MFGVLLIFDFSGEWMTRGHNVVYDTTTFSPLSFFTMDSMMIVAFEDQDNGILREVVPVQIMSQDFIGVSWDTKLVATKDSTIEVLATFTDPDWTYRANLIYVD